MQKLNPREMALWGLFLIVAAAMALVATLGGGDDLVGGDAPAFAARDAKTGELVELERLRGRVVILNVYATWCGPCKMEIPDLASFHQRNLTKNRPIQVYGVVFESGEADEALTATEKLGANYPILMGTPHIFERYHLRSYPTTLVIDPRGHVIARHEGLVDLQMLEDWSMDALTHGGGAG